MINRDFETKLREYGWDNVKRLGGSDRCDTNMLVVDEVKLPQSTPMFIALGENFPDALSGGVLAAKTGSPILSVLGINITQRLRHILRVCAGIQPRVIYRVSTNAELFFKTVLRPGEKLVTVFTLQKSNRYGRADVYSNTDTVAVSILLTLN